MRKGWATVPLAAALLAACLDFANLSGGAAAPDAGDASDAACGASQKSCVGKCVEQFDPSVGCSGECSACAAAPNAQAACVLQDNAEVCGIGACNPQYGNCDNQAENGCETHTTTSTNCGSCGASCGAQFCELQANGSYACSATCDAPSKICVTDAGSECVAVASDNENCGKCGASCTVQNGVGSCMSGMCALKCDTDYFACGGACVLPSNTQCGPSCAPCVIGTACDVAVGSSTYGSCVATSSGGTQCDAGTDLTADPNCGACGVDCASRGLQCCRGAFYLDGGMAPYACSSKLSPICGFR